MRPNFLCIKVILLAGLAVAQTGFSSTLTYFTQLTGLQGQEAKDLHDRIKAVSNRTSFLDCPIELIERQWRGPESVVAGVQYLQQFIKEASQAKPDYMGIFSKCLHTLYDYRLRDRQGLLRARSIIGDERERLVSQIAGEQDQTLMEVIVQSINKPTLCHTNRAAVHVAALIGSSSGMYQMDCVTPLGRRFTLKGPSIGVGIGIGASVSVPNSDRLNNSLSYHFHLFKRPERSLWYTSNTSGSIVVGGGVAIEQDIARRYRGKDSAMLYLNDMKAAIGLNIFTERVHNFMKKKNQSPFYATLVTAGLLDTMAQSLDVPQPLTL